MTNRTFAKAPEIGEFINGGRGYSMPGRVLKIKEHVTTDNFDHWIVIEDWNKSTIRVKRESNGLLYECEIVTRYE